MSFNLKSYREWNTLVVAMSNKVKGFQLCAQIKAHSAQNYRWNRNQKVLFSTKKDQSYYFSMLLLMISIRNCNKSCRKIDISLNTKDNLSNKHLHFFSHLDKIIWHKKCTNWVCILVWKLPQKLAGFIQTGISFNFSILA